MISRIQAAVLGFFLLAWLSVVTILVGAPEVYDEALGLSRGNRLAVEIVFLVVLSGFLCVLSIGVLRRWRWTFWLILVAFSLGVLRVPIATLQLSGRIASDNPTWYVLLQGVIGLIQFAIAVVMFSGYRRSGMWGYRN